MVLTTFEQGLAMVKLVDGFVGILMFLCLSGVFCGTCIDTNVLLLHSWNVPLKDGVSRWLVEVVQSRRVSEAWKTLSTLDL